MPTWGELLVELNDIKAQIVLSPSANQDTSAFDLLRRKYMKELSALTGRAVIVYATAFLENKPGMNDDVLQISLGDIQGFMEAVSNVKEREVDLFLHSPGGSAEAADSIVQYLRTRFDHIRVVVPVAAMSAATMVALAADEILMGAHSQLGPIDPQLTVFTPEGPRSAPAQAILDQFDLAKTECADPKNIGGWLPILRSYLPGLLAQCVHQRQLAETFAARSLEQYMFAGDPNAAAKAKATAAWFADFTAFGSHGRRVSRDDARAQGLNVSDLEAEDALQDAVLSVHHAVQHTLSGTSTGKIIENQHGRAWIRSLAMIVLQQKPGQGGPQGSAPIPISRGLTPSPGQSGRKKRK